MKNCKVLCSLLLTLALLCSFSVAAFADTPPDLLDTPALSSASVSVEPLPEAVDITPGSPASEPSSSLSEPASSGQPEASEEAQEQSVREEAAAPRRSNLPYFIGAAFAVLALICVALFCKFNGRK